MQKKHISECLKALGVLFNHEIITLDDYVAYLKKARQAPEAAPQGGKNA
ncbi:hypothetical protein [Roseovarius sp.]